MQKILIFSDVHWSTTTSIVGHRGKIYSQRLELLIQSMNWLNEVAEKTGCDAMVCAGDFFDKSRATDEELTALKEIKWNKLPCYFLCGNHESSVADLRFNSVKALESENHFIISEPTIWKYNNDENEIRFLPYIVESDRKPLNEYFHKGLGKTIIISHNDIAGIKYGGFESKIGFSINELEDTCDLCLNGHLHNSEWVSKNILNVGSTSAHNFTNDSYRYRYGVWILDLETNKLDFIENPYSLNFYKIDILTEQDISKLSYIKSNSVLSIKTTPDLSQKVQEAIKFIGFNIKASKICTERQFVANNISIADLQVNHLEKFVEFCKANIANTDILDAELAEICK